MLLGIVLIAVSLILAVFSFWQVRGADGGARIIWLALVVAAVMAGGAAAYLLHGLTTIRYVLGQDRLVIRWMREEQVVHFAEIVDTTYDPRDPVHLPGWEPFWPGYYVSTRRTPTGIWRSIATEEPRRRVRITTTRGVFAISPARPVRFIVELDRMRSVAGLATPLSFDEEFVTQDRGSISPVPWTERDVEPHERSYPAQRAAQPMYRPATTSSPHVDESDRWDDRYEYSGSPAPPTLPSASDIPPSVTPASERRSIVRPEPPGEQARHGAVRYVYEQLFRNDLLGDRIASNLIAIGVAIPLLMAAYLFSQYEGVPNPVPLHWDALGDVDRVGQPSALWLLPIMGVIVLIVNTFAATLLMAVDRFLSRLILLAIPIVQIVAFIALVRLVTA